jgi:hypothetical protein
MRTHDLPGFPDPNPSEGFSISGRLTGNGNSPAARASDACKHLLQRGSAAARQRGSAGDGQPAGGYRQPGAGGHRHPARPGAFGAMVREDVY